MDNMGLFHTVDYVIFALYAVMIVGLGLWLSRSKKGVEQTSNDYFLAGGTLTWWAIGASLIAANISAEHFIGMSGSGFRIGLAIAAYEWLAAVTLILVAKFLLPIMIEKKIYTMPQFLKERYNGGVSVAFAIFWLLVYLFVNLTSVSWLGALAMNQILGWNTSYCVFGLLVFAGIYSIYGGLKSVAWTDVLQVVFLVGGGLITAYFALDAVGGDAGNAWDGFKQILGIVRDNASDRHFNMIIPEGSIVANDKGELVDIFQDIPGLAVILGAMWLTNLGYWGFNQFIIQKGLAAKSLKEAKKGLIFAGYLKILIPLIVVIPGITAYALFNHPDLQANLQGLSGTIEKADHAYPWLLRNFAPEGIRGLAFAALVAAIVSSLASMLNSTSTIFTLDIYKGLINKDAPEKKLVSVGRWTAFAALVIAMFAAEPLLGGLDQAFQYIQEYTGFIYPGAVVVFGMGLLWKKATARAALWTAIFTIPLGILMKVLPGLVNWAFPSLEFPQIPFLIRMGYVCVMLIAIAVVMTLTDKKHQVKDPQDLKPFADKLNKGGWIFAVLATVALVAGLLFSAPLKDIAFESVFMLVALFGFLSLICFTNGKSATRDRKAYDWAPELFKTDGGFAVGALGIVAIIIALYAYFW